MQSTRKTILEELVKNGQATVNELADVVGLKPISVRHHLNALRADGLIDTTQQRQSVGRPTLIYHLTEKALETYPKKYHTLVDRLLEQIKESLSPEVAAALIDSLADALAADLEDQLTDLSPEERRDYLIEFLESEGFSARWQHTEDGVQLVEYHCPYYLVGQRHPEVCRIDERLIQVVVGDDVEKDSCLLSGDATCTFTIPDET